MSKRRTDAVGTPTLVELPKGDFYKDTGEGGMSFFLVVPEKADRDNRRNVSCEGEIIWRTPDVCLSPRKMSGDVRLDAGVLIGSTGLSLFSEEISDYFTADYHHLTDDGKALYDMFEKLYGEVEIVTLLDT